MHTRRVQGVCASDLEAPRMSRRNSGEGESPKDPGKEQRSTRLLRCHVDNGTPKRRHHCHTKLLFPFAPRRIEEL